MAVHHTCDGCGRTDSWSSTWQWYGALADLDGGLVVNTTGALRRGQRPIVKTCSDECRAVLGDPPDPRRGDIHAHWRSNRQR